MEYTDGPSKLTSDHNDIRRYGLICKKILVKRTKSEQKQNLKLVEINSSVEIIRPWKKSKPLRTPLDTKEDIKRRKILTISATSNLRRIFQNDKLTTNLKLKLINTYIEPIFIYNSETWTPNPWKSRSTCSNGE